MALIPNLHAKCDTATHHISSRVVQPCCDEHRPAVTDDVLAYVHQAGCGWLGSRCFTPAVPGSLCSL